MKPKYVRRFAGLLLLACATVLIAVWQLHARDAMREWDPTLARGANEPIPVRTVKVTEHDVEETIGGTAVTVPAQTAVISIPSSSSEVTDRQVQQVNLWPGSKVHSGDVLMEFDPSLFRRVVGQREAELDKSRQALAAITELNREKAASGLQLRDAQVAAQTAELELALAQRDLAVCTIESPIDGVIEEVNVVPQMRLSSGGTLAVIHQLDPIYVQMDFPMERIDSLELDQTADVVLDAFPEETFTGKVVRIAPVVSTKTRVLPVTIELANPNDRIRAGISGYVRIKSVRPNSISVPSISVIRKERKAMVVCVEDERAKIREVHTGPTTQDGQIEVLQGLHPGDEVVVYGQDAVEENDLVNVDWKQWTHRSAVKQATN